MVAVLEPWKLVRAERCLERMVEIGGRGFFDHSHRLPRHHLRYLAPVSAVSREC